MKGKLKDKDVSYVPELIHEIKMLWPTEISREYFKKLSELMPTRIQKVLVAKGECTKY
jgi:hypothetical protein